MAMQCQCPGCAHVMMFRPGSQCSQCGRKFGSIDMADAMMRPRHIAGQGFSCMSMPHSSQGQSVPVGSHSGSHCGAPAFFQRTKRARDSDFDIDGRRSGGRGIGASQGLHSDAWVYPPRSAIDNAAQWRQSAAPDLHPPPQPQCSQQARAQAAVGDYIEVFDVSHRDRLNGLRGYAVSWDAHEGKMEVSLEGEGKHQHLRLANLRVVDVDVGAHGAAQHSHSSAAPRNSPSCQGRRQSTYAPAPRAPANTLNPLEALRRAGGNHEMAFGAMAGHADASMVPPGGFKDGVSPGALYGYGHSFGHALGQARAETASLQEQVQELLRDHKDQLPELARYKDQHEQGIDDSLLGIGSEGRFESKTTFAKRLLQAGLLERQPNAKHEGQHVYHIISASNGGPDHTDNYLYALGGSFNIAIGDRFDHLNCFLAGKAKAQKAVAIAMKVANDSSMHGHIDKRGKQRPTTFFEGRHKEIRSADELYKMGQDLFRDMRQAARKRA